MALIRIPTIDQVAGVVKPDDLPGGLRSASKVLTNAQILALPTQMVEIVAPTETPNYQTVVTKMPLLLYATILLNSEAAAYGNRQAGSGLHFVLGDWDVDCSSRGDAQEMESRTTKFWQYIPEFYHGISGFTNLVVHRTEYISYVGEGPVEPRLAHNGISLLCTNSNQNFTGGHADNTMKVNVLYTVLTI